LVRRKTFGARFSENALSEIVLSSRSRFLGAVLAGGQSVRLGRPKWREPVGEVPMAGRSAAALAPHAREVVLVAGDPAIAALGFPVLADAPGQPGPLGGLVAALERGRAAGDAACLVLACDLPLVDADLVGAIVDAWDGEDVVAPERAGRLQPLCALWSVRALTAARAAQATANRSIFGLLDGLSVRIVPEAEWRPRTAALDPLLNVNTAADLARAETRLAEERSGSTRGSSSP
jgi:molybdenum cofactor guanylyltransferase